MRPPSSARPRWDLLVSVLGGAVVLYAVVTGWQELGTTLVTHERTIAVLVGTIVAGELARLAMPSGREIAPLASASALAACFLGPIEGEPAFDVTAGVVVLLVAFALAVAAVVRRVRGRAVGLSLAVANLLGVAVAAELARETGPAGSSLWDLQAARNASPAMVALVMVLVAALGMGVEVVVASAARSQRQGSPWTAAVRDELGEAAPLTFAVITSGPMIALMAPAFGLASIPAALFPLAITYMAVFRFARNRATYRQTIATLSLLTEHGGYTPVAHAERVATTSVRIGRALALSERDLRELEYAALLHDLGQISLREPIPGGATVLAAPSDQRDIAAEGARIIRHAEGLDTVAEYVEGQTTPYRLVRELGEPVPLPSRILKVANAYDDLTGGSPDPHRVAAAIERIHLGLGYEYDPEIVEALVKVTSDPAAGRVAEREGASR
jgi:hypothetical protein